MTIGPKPMYDERSELYLALKQAPVAAPIGPAAEKLAAKWRIPVAIATSLIEATVIAEENLYTEGQEARVKLAERLYARSRRGRSSICRSMGPWYSFLG